MPVNYSIFKRSPAGKHRFFDFNTYSCHNSTRISRFKVHTRRNLAFKIILVVFLSGLIALFTIDRIPSAWAADESKPRMVTFFTTMVDRCPEGWKEADYAQGRLLLGTTDASRVLSRSGEPMAYGEPTLHEHKITAKINTSELKAQGHSTWYFLDNFVPDKDLVFNKSYNITGDTRYLDNGNIPYRQMLVCEEETGNVENSLPGQVVALFQGKSCPAGWEKYDDLDGRFVLPKPLNARADQIGTPVGSKLGIDSGGRRKTKHNHQMKVGTGQKKVSGIPMELTKISKQYNLRGASMASGTIAEQKIATSASTKGHPYVELLACYKKDGEDLAPEEFPEGISLFFLGGGNCPPEWTEYTESRGYYLVGIPKSADGRERLNGISAGGRPLKNVAMATHTHPVDLDLNITQSSFYWSIWNGAFSPRSDYGKWGQKEFTGTSGAASAQLPYVTVTHCHIPEQHMGDPGERAR